MDKKKKVIRNVFIMCLLTLTSLASAFGQSAEQTIQFCGKQYGSVAGNDTITLFFNILDENGEKMNEYTVNELERHLTLEENESVISSSRCNIRMISSGKRIPEEFTFSVLVDRSIPNAGKLMIYDAINNLVQSAPDGCVYLSFFGDDVTRSESITKENFKNYKDDFRKSSTEKYFYGALYSKLAEFSFSNAPYEDSVRFAPGYKRSNAIASRASKNIDKNVLFVFTEGDKRPTYEKNIAYLEVTKYQEETNHIVPKVFAFYYTENGEDPSIENVLKGICFSNNPERQGEYMPANDMASVLENFNKIVNDNMYDFSYTYKVAPSQTYSGNVKYTAIWRGDEAGAVTYSIGTVESPWPERVESTADSAAKYLVALLVAALTIVFFYVVMKIIVPYCQSKAFAKKYYKKYVPDANVSKRICHYCRQEIQEGQTVVMKCKHVMHRDCWQQNGYKCPEYGQSCSTGFQKHVEWSEMLSKKSFRDCLQMIAGICAGFVSWIVYELVGRGMFRSASKAIVNVFLTNEEQKNVLFDDCVNKTSAFLAIGLLLGFFLSLIFRYNDEYRKKDWKIYLKIVGLSVLTGIIGMVAFAIGADVLCVTLSVADITYIPWYCSLPAYVLFSICVSFALTIKSSIPSKSALIGGGCAAVIGFVVLYCSETTGSRLPWMNMLLDFIIYGGGLGASLVTVRMLAEKYFLVIQNGVKAGLRIPIHKWMNATGGGNKVTIGMTGDCEIQMNWEKSNKVAKEHACLFIDHDCQLPMIKPLATGVIYNNRAELPVNKPSSLTNGDCFKIGDTTFKYEETE